MTTIRVLPYVTGLDQSTAVLGSEQKLHLSGPQTSWISDPARPRGVYAEILTADGPEPAPSDSGAPRKWRHFTSAILRDYKGATGLRGGGGSIEEYGHRRVGVALFSYYGVVEFLEKYGELDLSFNAGRIDHHSWTLGELPGRSFYADLPSDTALAVQVASIEALMFRPVPRADPRRRGAPPR